MLLQGWTDQVTTKSLPMYVYPVMFRRLQLSNLNEPKAIVQTQSLCS